MNPLLIKALLCWSISLNGIFFLILFRIWIRSPLHDAIRFQKPISNQRMERILDLLFHWKVVHNCQHEPYLKRWYALRTTRIAIFIHQFVRSDEDRALHDHPWNFIVIPIWQGYNEHQDGNKVRRVRPGMIAFRSAEYRHRVELIDNIPSWSLFIRFRERRVWGLWPNFGFIDSKTWWKDLCE